MKDWLNSFRKFQRDMRCADMLTSAIVWRWISRLSLEFAVDASSTAMIEPCGSRIGAPEHHALGVRQDDREARPGDLFVQTLHLRTRDRQQFSHPLLQFLQGL